MFRCVGEYFLVSSVRTDDRCGESAAAVSVRSNRIPAASPGTPSPPAAGVGVTGDGVADAVGTGVSGAGETDASGVVSGEGVGEAVNSGRRSSAAINAATYLVSGPQVLMY